MSYRLYYWPVPFRGHLIRYALALSGADWEDATPEEIARLMEQPPDAQPLPFMGPPLLHDHQQGTWISQAVATMDYIGSCHGLMPAAPTARALTLKIVCDCIDVLEEITCHSGRNGMWQQEDWRAFHADRLPHWMQIFETTGRAHGLTRTSGHMLGSGSPMLADLATAALWHTMTDKLPDLRPLLDREAPAVAALSDRIANLPAIATMRRDQDAAHGNRYCGGQIEASIRDMLAGA